MSQCCNCWSVNVAMTWFTGNLLHNLNEWMNMGGKTTFAQVVCMQEQCVGVDPDDRSPTAWIIELIQKCTEHTAMLNVSSLNEQHRCFIFNCSLALQSKPVTWLCIMYRWPACSVLIEFRNNETRARWDLLLRTGESQKTSKLQSIDS